MKHLGNTSLAMVKIDMHAIFFIDVAGCVFGTIHRSVTSAGASKAHHQRCEATPEIGLDRGIDKCIYMVEKCQHLAVILEKLDYLGVAARELLVGLITPGLWMARQSNTNPPPLPE